jgi:hypothetical protein
MPDGGAGPPVRPTFPSAQDRETILALARAIARQLAREHDAADRQAEARDEAN